MHDYTEPCCCFDASQYTGTPDARPVSDPVNVPEVIAGLDSLNNSGREADGMAYLEQWLAVCRDKKDWRAELTVLSELLGQYRRRGERDKGIQTVNKVMEQLRTHAMGSTVSGATILLNAATTMKCFGLAKESIPVFRHAARVYAAALDPLDYRFAGLYNNMALSFADIGETDNAEKYFLMAIRILEHTPGQQNDIAASWCNLAELYNARDPEDPRIENCLEKAWENLNVPGLPHDGYHAFTISKCAPSFEHLGFFLYAGELKRRAEEIYERS